MTPQPSSASKLRTEPTLVIDPVCTNTIGASDLPTHGISHQDLVHTADPALYAAKSAGHNCFISAPPIEARELQVYAS